MRTAAIIMVAAIMGLVFGTMLEHERVNNFHVESVHVSGWWDFYTNGNWKTLYDESGHRFWAESFRYEIGSGLHCVLWRESGNDR